MSSQDEFVRRGLWRNHDVSGWHGIQILVKEETAVKITNVVAICLAFSLPRLWILAKFLWPVLKDVYSGLRQKLSRHVEAVPILPAGSLLSQSPGVELQQMTSFPSEPARIAVGLRTTIEESPSLEEAVGSLLTNHIFMDRIQIPNVNRRYPRVLTRFRVAARNFRENPWTFTGIVALAMVLITGFICLQIITAICSGAIIFPGVAELLNPHCGVWMPEVLGDVEYRMSNSSIFTPIHDMYTETMFKAVSYAENCYKDSARLEECDFFYSRRIPFHTHHSVPCPFKGGICIPGNSSVLHLDTGYLDSRIFGVNEKHTCKFRMKKTCSPLILSEKYVRTRLVDDDDTRYVEYYYGDVSGMQRQGDKTFGETIYKPLTSQAGGGRGHYLIREFKGEALADLDRWYGKTVIPELRVPHGQITLYFILPQHIMYTTPNDDPIFPARASPARMTEGNPLFWNDLQRSTVLACVDTFELQHPRSGAIWYPRYQNTSQLSHPDWQDPSVAKSLHTMNMSYLASEYFDSRYTGMAEHFEVHKKIRDFYSSPLHHEQWKIEADKTFATRLALLQHHVLGIAQGIGRELPYARNLLLDYDKSGCGNVMFQSRGWKNISLFGLLGFLGLAVGIWISRIKVGDTIMLFWLLKEAVTLALSAIGSALGSLNRYCT